MKVPIDVEGEEPMDKNAQASEAAAEATHDVADEPVVEDADDEQALIDAAKRAGEEAAEKELAADAGKIRAERDELQKKLADVQDQIDTAKKQAADASERLVRLQADWDNYRRRTAAERLAEKERAAEKLVCSLLPVLDDMERALDHAATVDADEQMKSFVDGVSAVHNKMVDVLAKEGVVALDPTGQAFEPLSQQAVGRVEDPEAYDETVAQVYQKGYKMGEKVIRTAMVTVTYGGPKRPAEQPAAEGDAADAAGADADEQ